MRKETLDDQSTIGASAGLYPRRSHGVALRLQQGQGQSCVAILATGCDPGLKQLKNLADYTN